MPHIGFIRSSSGNGSTGGTMRKAKNPFSSRGACGRNSLQARMISSARSGRQSIGPAYTFVDRAASGT